MFNGRGKDAWMMVAPCRSLTRPYVCLLLLLPPSHSFPQNLKSDKAKQVEFERKLLAKTQNAAMSEDANVVLLDGLVCVYKLGVDVIFFVVGSANENELILSETLDGFFGALNGLLRSQLEKRVLLDNLDLVLLVVDELIDSGIILETNALAVANRVLMREDNDGGAQAGGAVADMTIGQAMGAAKQALARSMRSS